MKASDKLKHLFHKFFCKRIAYNLRYLKKHQIKCANVITRNVRIFQAKKLVNLKKNFPIVSKNISVVYNQFANQSNYRNNPKIRDVLTASKYRRKIKLKASKVVFRYDNFIYLVFVFFIDTC